jgi:hypothetical protein
MDARPMVRTIWDFSNGGARGDLSHGDWDYGYYKAECPSGSAVSAVAQTTDLKLTKILCREMNERSAYSCSTVAIPPGGGNNGSTSQGDWAYGYYKLTCGEGNYVKGVSRSVSTGELHAIFCCSYI